MSIPDRFYRIAKHKLGEMKDWFDKVDDEEDAEAELKRRRADARTDAKRELNDAFAAPATPANGTGGTSRNNTTGQAPSSIPMNTPRSPATYMGGGRPASYSNSSGSQSNGGTSSGYGSSGSNNGNNNGTGAASNITQPDPLDYHYKLLGLEPGADFASVQIAYNKLAARCDPARFPAGSHEEQQARQIRERLDVSFKQLREVLDLTATRFNLLEF